MDLNKDNKKFQFFKSKDGKLNFRGKSYDREVFCMGIIGMWVFYAVVSTHMFSPVNMPPPVNSLVHVSAVPESLTSVERKIKLIDKVTNLNSLLAAVPVAELSVKEIGEDLGIFVNKASMHKSSILVTGSAPYTDSSGFMKEEVSLLISKDNVVITWDNLSLKDAQDFANRWEDKVVIFDKVSNLKKLSVTVPMSPINLPQVEPEDKKTDQLIKDLEDKIIKLEKEQEKLQTMQNTNKVVDKAIQDNPELKRHDAMIRDLTHNFADIHGKILARQ